MSVKEAIKNKVAEVYGDQTPNVYKGNDYDGTRAAYGWWYKPFNATPVFLGTSLAEALYALDQVDTN